MGEKKWWLKILFLSNYDNDGIIINTETYFYKAQMLFELFYIKNDFVKLFAKFHYLFIYLNILFCTLW